MNVLKSVLLALLALLVVVLAAVFTFARQNAKLLNVRAGLPNRIQQTPERPRQEAQAPAEVSAEAPEIAVSASLSDKKQGWGPGLEVNELNQTVASISAQRQYDGLDAHFIFPDDGKVLYLTFDLGYENGYTGPILDTLASRGVKGTFFITREYADEAPDIVKRIIDEGHTLANHTVKHPSMPDVSAERAAQEINGLHDYIYEEYGYEMKLFRYPRGEFSERSLKQVSELGYQSVFWSFAYKDWLTDAQPDPTEALERVNGALHPGAIYLLHAVSSTNDQIMGDFVDHALAQGYRFGLVDERLGLVKAAAQSEEII